MIPWATIYPALIAWVTLGTGLDQVVVENGPRPFTEAMWGHLQVIGVEGHGMDDRDLVDVAVTDPVTHVTTHHTRQQISGQRTFTLRLRAESISQGGGDVADNPLERLRSTWELDALRAVLDAQNCAVATFGPSQMADYEVDERQISAWVLDVEINTAFTYIDTSPAPDTDTIERVTMTSAFVEADGTTPLPPALQDHP